MEWIAKHLTCCMDSMATSRNDAASAWKSEQASCKTCLLQCPTAPIDWLGLVVEKRRLWLKQIEKLLASAQRARNPLWYRSMFGVYERLLIARFSIDIAFTRLLDEESCIRVRGAICRCHHHGILVLLVHVRNLISFVKVIVLKQAKGIDPKVRDPKSAYCCHRILNCLGEFLMSDTRDKGLIIVS